MIIAAIQHQKTRDFGDLQVHLTRYSLLPGCVNYIVGFGGHRALMLLGPRRCSSSTVQLSPCDVSGEENIRSTQMSTTHFFLVSLMNFLSN